MSGPAWSIPGQAIALQLLAWSLPWLAASLVGLWLACGEFKRGFWLLSGAWCFVNAVIAWFGLASAPAEPDHLRRILLWNSAVDVVYVTVGVVMILRARPLVRGMGLAVIIQGAFLLIFDLFHAYRLPGG